MQANDWVVERMQRTKKESDAQANAACNEHAGSMGAVVVVWYNEENIMRAFWEWVSMKTLRCP